VALKSFTLGVGVMLIEFSVGVTQLGFFLWNQGTRGI